jgi:signal transduction histidine kinase
MEWQHTVYMYPMLLSAVISMVLVAYGTAHVYRNGGRPVTLAFVGLNVSIAIWTSLTAFKVLSTDPAVKLLAFKAFHVGSTFASPMFLVFALAYTDNDEWLSRRTLAVIFTLPVLTLLALFFNPNSIGILDWELITRDGVTTLEVQSGPASIVRIAYGLVLDLLAVGVIGWYALRAGWSSRNQVASLLVGIVPPAVVIYLELTDVYPPGGVGVNLVPASLAFTSLGFGIAVFRYKLFDIRPLGYRTAVEQSPNGIVILDEDETVRYANETASESLEREPLSIGERAEVAVPGYDDLRTEEGPVTVNIGQGDGRFFDLRRRSIERRGSTAGWIISMNDVTPQRTSRQTLEEQNQRLEAFADVVSHDLRNPLNVAQIHVDFAHEKLDGDGENLDTASAALTRMEDIIEDVLTLARQRQPVEDHEPVTLSPSANGAWEMVDTAEARLRVESDLAFEGATDRLQRLFENLFRNAVQHGTEDVTVTVGALDERSGFYVADDGPGIPEDQRDRVLESGYTTRSDGTGFGLAIISKIVDAHDWTLTVTESEWGGARFEISGVTTRTRLHGSVQ